MSPSRLMNTTFPRSSFHVSEYQVRFSNTEVGSENEKSRGCTPNQTQPPGVIASNTPIELQLDGRRLRVPMKIRYFKIITPIAGRRQRERILAEKIANGMTSQQSMEIFCQKIEFDRSHRMMKGGECERGCERS